MVRALLCMVCASALAAEAPTPRVVVVDLDGVIHPVTTEILKQSINFAVQQDARLLLVRLNTPGGFADATRRSIEVLIASPMPVVTYVAPSGGRAASAGFFILQAGDVAAMAPGTNTGAATPVMLGGSPDETLLKKATSDSAASLRSLAANRGRDADLAQKAVLEAKSFTEKEALDGKLIETIANDEQALLRWLDGREIRRFDGRRTTLHVAGAQLLPYGKTIRQKTQAALSDPNLALILTVLGAIGLYIEFTTPGLVYPGVAGGILLLLGLSGLSVLPITWTGAGLLLLALALFVLDTQVASHGVLTVGGAVAMILGSMMLVEGPIPELRVHLSTAIGLAVPFALISGFLVTIVVKARLRQATTGAEGMRGLEGVALTDLKPQGQVLAHGERWEAVADRPVEAGAAVVVKGMRGLVLDVSPAETTKEDTYV